MAGDPEKCRLNAMRCLRLAERARRLEVRERFAELADTWKRLAVEAESDQALLSALSDLDRGEPYDSLLLALNLRAVGLKLKDDELRRTKWRRR
jgi:hypothetical protein